MYSKTYKFFNQTTRNAMFDKVDGYISKTKSLEKEIVEIKRENGIEKIYRFDLGENNECFSQDVVDFLNTLAQNKVLFSKLNQYPDITHISLRSRLSKIFNVPRNNIVVSGGLDSIIDLITRVFFEYNDIYLMPVPTFFLFEHYSERMGAVPIFLRLDEQNDFRWTDETTESLSELIIKFKPKLIWLSNPNNPTGQIIEDKHIEDILKLANSFNVFVVIDEAYHEFIGGAELSAVKYTRKFENLMVLRSFSKAIGLAGIRLGYLITSSMDIVDALLIHRHHFPVTQLSLNIAKTALKDEVFITQTRKSTNEKRNKLFNNLNTLKTFKYIPSQTNIFMLRNHVLNAAELDKELKKRGIITSMLNITGVEKLTYLRVTICSDEDNLYFYNACKEIDKWVNENIIVAAPNENIYHEQTI